MHISTHTNLLAALCCIGLFQTTAHCTSYFYSGPVNGYVDAALTPDGNGYGGLRVNFGTLAETLIYDPVAGTLREVGYVTISPSVGTFVIVRSMPFPLSEVVGSATLIIGANDRISFDRTIVFNNSVNGWGGLKVPVSGYGIYNGTAFSERWDLDVPTVTTIIAADSTSLTFSQRSVYGILIGKPVIPGTDLETAAADGAYYVRWQLDSAVAQAIPAEHSTCTAILGAMMLVFVALRRWKNAAA